LGSERVLSGPGLSDDLDAWSIAGVHCASFRLNALDGYTDRMAKPESVAQAGLVGWRKAIADSVAPRAASRAPVSEERLRAAIGAAFFLLSLYYVTSTIARMIKSAQS
jgi:hypothetical protein